MKFEIYTRKDNRIGIRLKGNNGEIVLAGEGYHSEGNARRAAKAVRDSIAKADIIITKEIVTTPIRPKDAADYQLGE